MEVFGRTLPEAYHKALVALYHYGSEVFCHDYNEMTLEMPMTMVVENPFEEPMISKIFPGGHKDLQQYIMEIRDGIFDFEVGKSSTSWEYTYHQRMWNYNQVNFVIDELRSNPNSRRAVIDIRDNTVDQNTTHPACLQHIQFMIRHGQLDMYVTMRSNDAFRATFMNAIGFIFLQKAVAEELGVEVGRYEHRANSFHVYEKSFDAFKKAVKKIKEEEIEDLTYDYVGFYKELMEAAVDEIWKKVEALRGADKYDF